MIALGCGLISSSVGCAGYQIGNGTLFRPDVRTVHVPVFESQDFRRGLGERLTEAVVKEIEERTPYKVVHTPDADSRLVGDIIRVRKRVQAENRNDEPRVLETEFRVEVRWFDRQGNSLMPRALLSVSQEAHFVPEAGQSMATGQQEAIGRLAKQIVDQMEMPW